MDKEVAAQLGNSASEGEVRRVRTCRFPDSGTPDRRVDDPAVSSNDLVRRNLGWVVRIPIHDPGADNRVLGRCTRRGLLGRCSSPKGGDDANEKHDHDRQRGDETTHDGPPVVPERWPP